MCIKSASRASLAQDNKQPLVSTHLIEYSCKLNDNLKIIRDGSNIAPHETINKWEGSGHTTWRDQALLHGINEGRYSQNCHRIVANGGVLDTCHMNRALDGSDNKAYNYSWVVSLNVREKGILEEKCRDFMHNIKIWRLSFTRMSTRITCKISRQHFWNTFLNTYCRVW